MGERPGDDASRHPGWKLAGNVTVPPICRGAIRSVAEYERIVRERGTAPQKVGAVRWSRSEGRDA